MVRSEGEVSSTMIMVDLSNGRVITALGCRVDMFGVLGATAAQLVSIDPLGGKRGRGGAETLLFKQRRE